MGHSNAIESQMSTQPNTISPDSLSPSMISSVLGRMEHSLDAFQKNQEKKWRAFELGAVSRPEKQMPHTNFESDDGVDVHSFSQFLKSGTVPMSHKNLTATREGGFLIPTVLEHRLSETLQKQSILRILSRSCTIFGDHLELVFDQKDTEVGWIDELSERNETKTPELFKLTIPVHHLFAKPRVSQTLLDDSKFDIENWLLEKIAHQMAALENLAFLKGDGNNKPKGILSYPLVPVGAGKRGALESLKTGVKGGFKNSDSLVELVNTLSPHYLGGAAWIVSRGALSALRLLKDATGRFLWQPTLSNDSRSTLLGYPIHVCDGMPELNPEEASASVLFGNFYAGYQIVDRTEMGVLRDPFSAKPFVEFYATKRVGGDVVDYSAIKVLSFDTV